MESEVIGEGESFEEAAQDAVAKRNRNLDAGGTPPESREWLKVIRTEVQAESHNQWVTRYRVVIPGP